MAALSSLDYPDELVEVVVVVDDDEETARLARLARPGARVLFRPDRGGKALALNRGLVVARGEVVVMTDANNVLDPGSLRAAVRHFADPDVVVVAGRRGERGSAYDAYEHLLRRLETRSGSVAAVSGEFVAVRRAQCPPFPADAVVDDLWLLCAMVAAGGRAVYEPAASGNEPSLPAGAELSRRSRMAAGRFQLTAELPGLPMDFAVRLVSHKFGRLALPFTLPLALGTSLALARSGRTQAAAAVVQLGLYLPGVAYLAGRRPRGPLRRVAKASGQFILGNYAVGLGVVRGMRRRQGVIWEPVR